MVEANTLIALDRKSFQVGNIHVLNHVTYHSEILSEQNILLLNQMLNDLKDISEP